MAVAKTEMALFGLRVLIVEDRFLQADELRCELEVLGAEVLGPAPNVEQALRLLERTPQVDAAVLDIGLHGELAYPVAAVLQDRGIPFAFLTALEEAALPERYRHVPLWSKPQNPANLPDRIAQLLRAEEDKPARRKRR